MLIEIGKLPCACHASLIVVAAFPQTLRRHTCSFCFTPETVCCFLFPSRASGKSKQWHHQDTANSVGAFHFGTHWQLQTQRQLVAGKKLERYIRPRIPSSVRPSFFFPSILPPDLPSLLSFFPPLPSFFLRVFPPSLTSSDLPFLLLPYAFSEVFLFIAVCLRPRHCLCL